MARCDCHGGTCDCVITAGANVTVTGAGTATSPFVISATGGGDGSGGGIPPGTVVEFAGAIEPPGWLLCNGQGVSRDSFPALFAAIGTLWGAGDGFSTFNVPAMGGRVPVGVQQPTFPLGAVGGAATQTLTEANLPAHSHTQGHTHTMGHTHVITHNHPVTNTGGQSASHTHGIGLRAQQGTAGPNYVSEGRGAASGTATSAAASANHTHQVATPTFTGSSGAASNGTTSQPSASSTGVTGGGQGFNNMQPWVALNYLIKT